MEEKKNQNKKIKALQNKISKKVIEISEIENKLSFNNSIEMKSRERFGLLNKIIKLKKQTLKMRREIEMIQNNNGLLFNCTY